MRLMCNVYSIYMYIYIHIHGLFLMICRLHRVKLKVDVDTSFVWPPGQTPRVHICCQVPPGDDQILCVAAKDFFHLGTISLSVTIGEVSIDLGKSNFVRCRLV